MLDCKEPPGAAEPGLNLVGDKQGAVTAAQSRRLAQIVVGRYVDAFALDRLDDECRDVPRRQRPLKRREIVEGHDAAMRQQGLETAAEDFIAIERQRTVGQAVKRMLAVDDSGPPGGAAGKLDCGLDRLGAGVGKKYLVEIRRELQQPLCQHAGERRDVELDQIGQIGVEHTLEGFAQCRMIAPDGEHAVSAQEIEIFVALAVEQILSGAAAEADIISNRPQHPDHLLVEMARMRLIAVGFILRVEVRNVDVRALERAVARIDQMRPMAQLVALLPP